MPFVHDQEGAYDEGTARRRDYLMTHTTHNRQTSMPPAGFESAIPAGDRPHTIALDRSSTEIGTIFKYEVIIDIQLSLKKQHYIRF
jgi:hypothetical protein